MEGWTSQIGQRLSTQAATRNLQLATSSRTFADACLLVSILALGLFPSFAQVNKTWNGSSNPDWFNATNWIPAGVPATNDNIYVTNYTTINLTAVVTIFGQFNWLAGNLTGSNALTIASNGVLNIGGSSVNLYIALTNHGSVNWQSGAVDLINDGASSLGTIWNQAGGLWDIQCDQQIRGLSGHEEFQNAGTLRKSASAGTTSFTLPLFNSGTVAVLQGTLNLNDGGPMDGSYGAAAGTLVQFSSGAFRYSKVPVFAGAGAFQFTGGTLTLLNDVIPNLQLMGGTVGLGTNFQGGTITNLTLPGSVLSGNYVVSGTFNCGGGLAAGSLAIAGGGLMNWTRGTVVGPLTVATNATLSLNGVVLGLAAALTNLGTVNWQGGELDVYNDGSSAFGALWNQPGGLWSIQCDQLLFGSRLTPFQNAGTVSKSAGAGTTPVDLPLVNSGTVSVFSGTLGVNGGLTNTTGTLECGLSGKSSFGQIAVSGNATLSGALNVTLLNGFVPALSNSFAVVTYSSYSNVFDTVTLPTAGVWVSNYGPTAFTATVINVNKLVFTAAPGGTNAGAVLAPVVVHVQDLNGNPIATNGLPISIQLSSGNGILSGTLTQPTDANGKATFNDLSINLAGTKTLQATCLPAGLSPVTSGTFIIAPAAPSQLALTASMPSPQPDGYVLSPPPVVLVGDRFGNVISNSAATITAHFSSDGGGALTGTTNVNADGATGSATFRNLVYHLADPGTAEPIVLYFTAFGLTPATNNTVTVRPVLTSITLHDGNSVIEIDPTTERGLLSWTVDGINQVFQHWFWLQRPQDTTQTSVDYLSAPYRDAYSLSNAVLSFLDQKFTLQIAFGLQGGAPGSHAATLAETLTITNVSAATLSMHVFDYADFDLAGAWTNDSLAFPNSQTAAQTGKGMMVTQVVTPVPAAWEGSWYAITLDELDGSSPAHFSDTITPSFPGDQTFAFQWYVTLSPGKGFVLDFSSFLQPTALALSIAPTSENVLLSWQTNGSYGFQLQSLTPFPDRTAWSPVGTPPAIVGDQYQVILPKTSSAQLYRLQR